MNILMISRGFPTKKDPQWGCFEQDQAEALCRYGHNVVVVSVDSRFRWKFRKIGITHQITNGVHYYNSFWIPNKVVSVLFGSRFAFYVRDVQLGLLYKAVLKKNQKPDVIYSHFFANTCLGVFLKRKYNIPLVGIEHAARFNSDKLDSYTYNAANFAYKNTDAIISVSSTLRDRLYFHFKVDSHVVHNLVSHSFEVASRCKKDADKFVFVSVASVIYRKGFDLLIKAFKKSELWKDGAQLYIIGDGDEFNNIQSLITSLNLDDYVILAGKKTKNEILNILCESNVFVLSSRSENFSVAVLEALSIGLPVVSSKCGGIMECINDKNGLLVEVEDVLSLSSALKRIYYNYSSYDSDYIKLDYNNRFSSSAIAMKLTNIFEQVVSLYNTTS